MQIVHPRADSDSQLLTTVNGVLYFAAYDAAHGQELWKSNGTGAGTVLVKDLFPGENSGYPRHLVAVRSIS